MPCAQAMAAGDCLIFDDRILHRGLANGSQQERWVAYFSYLLAFADPEGTLKRLALPARLLAGDAVELRARLLDEGLAIAAGPGGAGSVWIADLRLEDLSLREPPRVRASSGRR